MADIYWLKQGAEPLFGDLIWSRPENRNQAGKLLIVGGNLHGFAKVADAYAAALAAGVGLVKVVMPDKLRPVVSHVITDAEFAPSTNSGSFRRAALAELVDLASWADGVLLAGDFGHNSETAVLLETFLIKTNSQVTLVNDTIDQFLTAPLDIFKRADTTLVMELNNLQKMASRLGLTHAITNQIDLTKLVGLLHDLSQQYKANLVIKHVGQVLVACRGRVSTTKQKGDNLQSATKIGASCTVWWLQNPSKPFAALTTALFVP